MVRGGGCLAKGGHSFVSLIVLLESFGCQKQVFRLKKGGDPKDTGYFIDASVTSTVDSCMALGWDCRTLHLVLSLACQAQPRITLGPEST